MTTLRGIVRISYFSFNASGILDVEFTTTAIFICVPPILLSHLKIFYYTLAVSVYVGACVKIQCRGESNGTAVFEQTRYRDGDSHQQITLHFIHPAYTDRRGGESIHQRNKNHA